MSLITEKNINNDHLEQKYNLCKIKNQYFYSVNKNDLLYLLLSSKYTDYTVKQQLIKYLSHKFT
jgi:hypothetical protein